MKAKKTGFKTLAVFLSALALAGCGPSTYVVQGKVTFEGQPPQVKTVEGQKLGRLRVWIVKRDGANPPEKKLASVSPDGTFVFEGINRPTAGKYQVCVTWQDDYPMGPDKLDKQFGEGSSQIYRNIPADGDITIDVSRPGG
jgi:hypothetical protein